MTWQNPWAWAGIAAIGLPVLIHLLGQGHARRQRFPTLRFFGAARPLPTRRTRPHDLLLLLVRVAIVAVAVAALAQPLIITRERRRAIDNALVRAVVIDTSASMARFTAGGERGILAAMHRAGQLADSAQGHVMLLANAPSRAIPGAIAWLARQTGRSELVVVSDFQPGTIEAEDVAKVPANVGVRLVRIPMRAATEPITTRSRQGDIEFVTTVSLTPEATQVDWRALGTAPPAATQGDLVALSGADEAAGATATAQAARVIATPLPLDTSHAIAIVYPHAAERAAILQRGTPLHTPWMANLVVQLRFDPMLAAAAATATPTDSVADNTNLAVARTNGGRPVILAVEASVQGRDRLVLLPLAPAGNVVSAALIAAATRALSTAPPVSELDPAFTADSALRTWQRAPATSGNVASGIDEDQGDGRWLWLLALVLLGAETLLRRTHPDRTQIEPIHDVAG